MAERARAVYYVLDSEGRPIPTATITLRQKGTSTNITETIYAADDPDTSQLTNGAFFSGADGKVEFYLTDPKRLDMLVTKSGYTSQTIPLDVSTISAGYTLVAEEGSNLTARTKLNFIGSGVTAADDAANGRTNVTVKPVATDPIWDAAGDLVYGTGADAAARLAIGTAGQVLKVNSGATAPEWGAASTAAFVGARVTKSANQSIANATETALTFDVETYDASGWHNNVTNNDRITPTQAGYVRASGVVHFASNSTGYRYLELRKNATVIQSINLVAVSGDSTRFDFCFDPVVMNGTTDYLDIRAYQNSGAALDVQSGTTSTSFAVEFLGT